MKLFTVMVFIAAVASAPQNPSDAQILYYENTNDADGSYRFAFEQSDGTYREERGQLNNKGTDSEALFVVGKYSWIAPDGKTYTVTYTADENGFHPELVEKQPLPPAAGGVPANVVASLVG